MSDMPVTEVAYFTLQPNADLAPIAEAEKTLIQQPGCISVRSSRLHEDANKLLVLVDWASVSSHHAFEANEAVHAPSLASLQSVMARHMTPYHATLLPYPPTVLDNADGKGAAVTNVTEFAEFYFRGGDVLTPEKMMSETKTILEFLKLLRAANPEGFSGETATGWAMGEVEYNEKKCRILVLAIGWDSLAAHLRFRDSEDFARIVPLLRAFEDLETVKMCHVSNHTLAATG
ncbi:Uu.00g042590.m01.CDS01 [Anthostomella pinea]|uniref:Uu.00g042590.m01.CDS01 n=1 Tax=Anthostomella pinea TaxID=933095 RepID=A0AAI8YE21_9PEZI|nr:Uu.00g042590.m01.CDS01 [Anthostomella pinea]